MRSRCEDWVWMALRFQGSFLLGCTSLPQDGLWFGSSWVLGAVGSVSPRIERKLHSCVFRAHSCVFRAPPWLLCSRLSARCGVRAGSAGPLAVERCFRGRTLSLGWRHNLAPFLCPQPPCGFRLENMGAAGTGFLSLTCEVPMNCLVSGFTFNHVRILDSLLENETLRPWFRPLRPLAPCALHWLWVAAWEGGAPPRRG